MSVRSKRSKRRTLRPQAAATIWRLLDPIDDLAQTIYSVLIVLIFTLAYQFISLRSDMSPEATAQDIADLRLAMFGAALAWGLIDGVMYILLEVLQRGERLRLLQRLQDAPTEEAGLAIIAEELDYILEPIASEDKRRTLHRVAFEQLRTSQPQPIGFKRADFTGALGSLLISVIVVIPSLLPLFIFSHNYLFAIRASNLVSFIVLFWAGYRWGQYTGVSPWRIGLLLVGLGALMVAIAIVLGG
jgi:VIT1/CCC1 family predicted Fe2+/Mn2+ transporter